MKEKICKELLKDVNIMSAEKRSVFVLTENFDETNKYLKQNNFSFTPYRFIKCFEVKANFDEIKTLSNKNFVSYIEVNACVQAERKESDFMHLNNLTHGKFLGQNQTICFIDTGINTHFDFIFPHSRIIKFVDLINGKQTPYDDNGHGTFVSGIASGNPTLNKEIHGFAPLSNIIMIKALNSKGSSDSNVILDAMQWVYENHKAYKISVVCLSLGADATDSDPLSLGAQALWQRGITVIAAAGNSGPNEKTIKSPGNNPYIITVGALDLNSLKIADFSSRGPTIYGHKPDLVAPAVDIISCSNKVSPYTSMSGTSVATPIVAGICADIKSRFPNMTNNDIKRFLIKNCHPLTYNKNEEGAGILDFYNLK